MIIFPSVIFTFKINDLYKYIFSLQVHALVCVLRSIQNAIDLPDFLSLFNNSLLLRTRIDFRTLLIQGPFFRSLRNCAVNVYCMHTCERSPRNSWWRLCLLFAYLHHLQSMVNFDRKQSEFSVVLH